MYQHASCFPKIFMIFHGRSSAISLHKFLVAPIVFEGCGRAHLEVIIGRNSTHFARTSFFSVEGEFTRLRGGGRRQGVWAKAKQFQRRSILQISKWNSCDFDSFSYRFVWFSLIRINFLFAIMSILYPVAVAFREGGKVVWRVSDGYPLLN